MDFGTARENSLHAQQTDFDHVVNADQDLRKVERLTDEVPGASSQGAQFVARFGGDDEDGKVLPPIDLFQLFHDLEAVQDWHLEIEQNRGVAVLTVKLADLSRFHR
jgi:hypothetical protein